MKRFKLISLLMLICVLTLIGCTDSTEQNNAAVPSTPVVTTKDQVEIEIGLSEEKKYEIESAWNGATGYEFGGWFMESDDTSTDGVRYYGSYEGYDILFASQDICEITTETIGDIEFEHNFSFALYAYKDGRFHSLKDAYDSGLITDESLKKIGRNHAIIERKLYPIINLPNSDEALFGQMKAAFLRQFVHEDGWSGNDLKIVYYGDFEGAHVAFINGILAYTQALTSETIDGLTFHYNTGQKLLVFYDGELMGLQAAFDRGYLTHESLVQIHRAFRKDDNAVTE